MKTEIERLAWLGGVVLVTWALAAQSPSPPAKSEAVNSGAVSNPAALHVLYPSSEEIATTNGFLAMALAPAGEKPPLFVLDGRSLTATNLRFDRMWMGRSTRLYPPGYKATNAAGANTPKPVGQLPDKVLWLASTMLTPGDHELRIGDKHLRVSQLASTTRTGASTNSPLFVWHPPSSNPADLLNCALCHDAGLPKTERTLGLVRLPQACYSCHDEGGLPLIHRHVMDPLSRCQMCHDPHGSRRPKLLIDSQENLCIQCHAAGHSKS